MNWSRGLFRLWLVVSVLWAGFALLATDVVGSTRSYLDGEFMRTDIEARDLSVSPPDNGLVTVSFLDTSYELKVRDGAPSEEEWPRLLDALAEKTNRAAKDHNADLLRARSNAIEGAVIAAFPPLFLLAVGAGLLWALRGFAGGRKG